MAKPLASPDPQVAVARKRARRTAWVIAGIALAIYLGFLVLGMGGYVH